MKKRVRYNGGLEAMKAVNVIGLQEGADERTEKSRPIADWPDLLMTIAS